MGGSEYYEITKVYGNQIPRTNPIQLKTRILTLLEAIEKGYIASCHDISQGGMAVCVSEMALGGYKGVRIDAEGIVNLFSESNSRWVIEVRKGKESEVENLFGEDIHRLGEVTGSNLVIGDIDLSLSEAREAWENPLWKMMG